MRQRICGIVLVVVCLDPSGRAVHGISNGNLTADFPSSAAVLYSLCGGTLIGCQTVLTAKHCALGDESVFMRHVNLQHAGLFDVDLANSNLNVGDDLAVLKLTTPVTRIRPTQINERGGALTGSGTVVGWGCNYTVGGGLKHWLPASISLQNATGNDALLAVMAGHGCSGDSGGSILMDSDAGQLIAGTVYGGGFGAVSGPSTYVHRDAIRAAGGSDLENRACGSGAQVGDPNSTVTAFSGSLSPATPQMTHQLTVAAGTTELRIGLNYESNASAFEVSVRARFGALPTATTYDCIIDFGHVGPLHLSCTHLAPQAGTYYIVADRLVGSGTYQITATTFADCTDSLNAGIACDDSTACTVNDTCQAGACTGTPLANGTACAVNADAECMTGSCQDGDCVAAALADGTPCTPAENQCSAGACQAGTCAAQPAPAPDGTPCTLPDDGNPCTSGSVCMAGACSPEAPVPDGTACSVGEDGNECTVDLGGRTCQAGVCSPESPVADGTPCYRPDGNDCTDGPTVCAAGICMPEPPLPDGTPCEDYSSCTGDGSCRNGSCAVGGPRTDCNEPIASGASSLLMASTASGEKLKWKIRTAAMKSDLGDPFASYELCVFDQYEGRDRIIGTMQVPEDPSPATPGWAETRTGIRYVDKTGTHDGITSLLFATRRDGTATIKLRGIQVTRLPMIQETTVTMQLANDNACWSARFSTSKSNTGSKFSAKSD